MIWLGLRGLDPAEKTEMIDAIKRANYSWLALSGLFALVSHFSRALRWKMLLAPMGYRPSTTNAFLAIMVNYVANLGIPRSGEIARCWVLNKYENIPIRKSIGTVAAERAVDLIFLLILLVFVFILQLARLKHAVAEMMTDLVAKGQLLLLVIVPLLLAGFFLYMIRKRILQFGFVKKISDVTKGILEGLKAVKNVERPHVFIAHSIFIWFMYLMMLYVCFFCLPETSDLGINAAFTILAFGSIAMIVTPGGIGAYPIAVNRSLLLYGIAEKYGKAIGWIAWGGGKQFWWLYWVY